MPDVNEQDSSLLPAARPERDWGRIARLFTGIFLIGYSWVMFAAVPVPYIKIEPGSATNVNGLISIEGASTYDARGQLLFLTVALSKRVTPFEAVASWFDDDVELVREEVYTGDRSREELTRINLAAMRESELVAIKVALEHLGYEVNVLGGGALVTNVVADQPAAGHLRVGDVLVAVDDRRVTFSKDVIEAVRDRRPGDTVAITVDRSGEERTFEIATAVGETGAPQIGINLVDNFDFQFPLDVDIDTGQVGGPSAGLAFALAVIDELTEGELTGGKIVAVTGQIDADGAVEPVGGVEQKAVAARQAGAELMIVPKGEAEAARPFAGDMDVVAVADLDDALTALAGIGGNALALPSRQPPPS